MTNRYGIDMDDLSVGLEVRTVNGEKGIIQSINRRNRCLEISFKNGYSKEVGFHQIDDIEPFPDEDTECWWE